MHLPSSTNLPVNKLAAVFKNTSATYKFYWFIAIIELVEEGHTLIPKQKLFSRMISNSWYTLNYFHISFGQFDNLQKAVKSIIKLESLTVDEKKEKLHNRLENPNNPKTIKELNHFDINVPHRFLTPWLPCNSKETDNQLKSRIYFQSQIFLNDSLYALHEKHIQINPIWTSYIKSNTKVLKDFCYWNLSLFLQTRNPNVPDIPNKLIKPATRSSLAKQNNNYWKVVFQELGSIDCIFTNTKLIYDERNYAIDHFIPHAFVSHDLIWNLLPIEKKFNSKKSDKLPQFETYFDSFYNLQKTAFEINKHHNSKNKYFEEFLTIFPSNQEFDKQKLASTIQPLLTIANNNGFMYM